MFLLKRDLRNYILNPTQPYKPSGKLMCTHLYTLIVIYLLHVLSLTHPSTLRSRYHRCETKYLWVVFIASDTIGPIDLMPT